MSANRNVILAKRPVKRDFIQGQLPGKPTEYESCTLVMARLSLRPGTDSLPDWIPHRVFSFSMSATTQLTGPYPVTMDVWISKNDLNYLQGIGMFEHVSILKETEAAIVEILQSKEDSNKALKRSEDPKLPVCVRNSKESFENLQLWLHQHMPCVLSKSGPDRSMFSEEAQANLSSTLAYAHIIRHCYVPVDLLPGFEIVVHQSDDAITLPRSILFALSGKNSREISDNLEKLDDRIQIYNHEKRDYEVYAVPFDIASTAAVTIALNARGMVPVCLSDPLLDTSMTDYRWFFETVLGEETDESLAVELIAQGRVDPLLYIPKQSKTQETSLLHRAAEKGWNKLASLLLEPPYSFPVDESSYNNKTALYLAAQNGHHSVVKTLLAKKADCHITSTPEKRTPLLIAASQGHVDVVRTLIDKGGANPDAGSILMTPIAAAVTNKHQPVVECLLARHADVRLAPNNSSNAPYFLATQSTTNIFDLIVQHGGDEVPPLKGGEDQVIAREQIGYVDRDCRSISSSLILINPKQGKLDADYINNRPLMCRYAPERVTSLISQYPREELYFCKTEFVSTLKTISDPDIKHRIELITRGKADTDLIIITPWQNACLAANKDILDRMKKPADLNQDLIQQLQDQLMPSAASSSAATTMDIYARKALEDTLFLYRYHGEALKQKYPPSSVSGFLNVSKNDELKELLSSFFQKSQTSSSYTTTKTSQVTRDSFYSPFNGYGSSSSYGSSSYGSSSYGSSGYGSSSYGSSGYGSSGYGSSSSNNPWR